jgi:hypothetical protein
MKGKKNWKSERKQKKFSFSLHSERNIESEINPKGTKTSDRLFLQKHAK